MNVNDITLGMLVKTLAFYENGAPYSFSYIDGTHRYAILQVIGFYGSPFCEIVRCNIIACNKRYHNVAIGVRDFYLSELEPLSDEDVENLKNGVYPIIEENYRE